MAQLKRRDITEVVENYLCHSCGSCFSSCGHNSIAYQETTAGYIFPKIDYESCTNCGLCFDVCPGDHFGPQLKKNIPHDPFIGNIEHAYVGFSNDTHIYQNSQSGGVTTEVVKYLLEYQIVNAAVVTVMNDNTLQTEAKIITSSKDLLKSQKSKYVPTSLTALMPELSKIEGKIAVVGLSCHMHGFENLHKIDKKLNERLIKIGLICDRVMLYSAIDYLTKDANYNVNSFVFRDTTNTPYPGDITFYDGDILQVLNKKNRKNMKDFFTPLRCMLCFDKMNIYSDIVLGDPHAIEGVNKDKGESLVITRTLIGEDIIQNMLQLNLLRLRKVNKESATMGQGIEQKRKKFNANIQAWQSLGFPIPDYAEVVFDFVDDVDSNEVNKAKEQIDFAIKLDKSSSREDVIQTAQSYQNKKKSKKTIFTRIKNIFK